LRIAGLGFLLWLTASYLGYFADVASQLVALGAVTAVPLGVAAYLSDEYQLPRLEAIAVGFISVGAPVALASFLFTRGPLAAALTLPWVLATLVAGSWALARLLRRGLGPIEELAIDVGQLYLSIGALWLLAARGAYEPLGFREPVVTFTANHFHFAGFAAPVIAGLMGRAIGLRHHPGRPAESIASRGWQALAKASIGVVIAGVPLVAAGIQFSRTLEAPAAILLGLGMLGTSACLAKIAHGRAHVSGLRHLISATLLSMAACSLVLSMGFAVAFTTTGSATREAAEPLIPFATMLRFHAVVNVFGFAIAALLAFLLVPAPARLRLPAIPLPKLAAKGFVGPDYFERLDAVDDAREALGQLTSLGQVGGKHFDAAAVHAQIRRFYEETSRFSLVVTPDWRPPFRLAGRVVAAIARKWLGNLELPTRPEVAGTIGTRVFSLKPQVDRRVGARAYVRTYTESGHTRANYVGSYASADLGGRPHLVAVFPLPFICLVGVLRFDPARESGLTVSSAPRSGEGPAGEGVYLATPVGLWRLPINERIQVWVGDAGEICAEHDLFVLGLHAFCLRYAITALPVAASSQPDEEPLESAAFE
jgi:hypothetical protein